MLDGITTSCCNTNRQSPINLVTASAQGDANYASNPLTFSPTYFKDISNGTYDNDDGHTARYTPEDGVLRFITGGPLRDDIYELIQFHFHWGTANNVGSEHSIDGTFYPMEVHLVHRNSKYSTIAEALMNVDGFAVIGIVFEEDDSVTNDFFQGIDRVGAIQFEHNAT